MFSFKSVYFVIFTIILHLSHAKISDKRLCVDERCSELVSLGKTLQKYVSPEEGLLSFGPNVDVKVFSYGAGSRPELVGLEIGGKRGYVNKRFIRETKIVKIPKLLVDTELASSSEVPSITETLEIKADPTAQPYEIVDGTKIPLDLTATSNIQEASYIEKAESTTPLSSVPIPKTADLLDDTASSTSQKTALNPVLIENLLEDQEDDDDDDDDDDEEMAAEDEIDDEEDEPIDIHNIKAKPGLPKEISSQEVELESISLSNEIKEDSEKVVSNITERVEVNTKENTPAVEKIKEAVMQTPEVNIQEIPENVPANEASSIELNYNISEASTTATENLLQDPLTNSIEPNAIPVEPIIEPVKTTEELDKSLPFIPEYIVKEETIHPVNVEESTEGKSAELDLSVDPTTEVLLEVEAPPPGLNPVTEEPLAGAQIEQTITVSPVLVDIEKPTIEETLEGVDSLVEQQKEPTNTGILGGLQNILPMFAGGAAKLEESGQPVEKVVGQDEANELIEEKIDVGSDSIQPLVENSTEILQSSEVIQKNFSEKVEEPQNANLPKIDQVKSDEFSQVKNEPTDVVTDEKTLIEDSQPSDEGFLAGIQSFFGFGSDTKDADNTEVKPPQANDIADYFDTSKLSTEHSDSLDSANIEIKSSIDQEVCDDKLDKCPQIAKPGFCDKDSEDCQAFQNVGNIAVESGKLARSFSTENLEELFIDAFSSDLFLYLTTTALSVLVLIFVWIFVDKCRREGPLIARINNLEQQLLATTKENEALQEKSTLLVEEKTELVVETVSNEIVEELNTRISVLIEEKLALEEQIQALEKELDNSTEVGIELNKIISEMLSSGDGSEILKENLEQMQKKLLEQQDTINGLNATLSVKETENHELKLELDITRKKVADLQAEVNSMVDKILRIEDEKERQHHTLETEIITYQNKCKDALAQEHVLKSEIMTLNQKIAELQRLADIKVKEYNSLKETLSTIKSVKNDKDSLKSFLNVSEIKAQLEQMRAENLKYSEQLAQEREANIAYSTQLQNLTKETNDLRKKYEIADKEKVEINTKLEVLNNYFKEKEGQMQKEISKYESLWAVKEGEATSTTERIRYMQEELQNYKQQNENLKQEIVNQEVELKSQISMLEKKNQENWVTNRQTERKLEEARQEAALLRNRLTLRERAIADSNNIRMQSPLHQNGELPNSPPPIDPTQSPPPLFHSRDHMTKSPPIPGLPPPPFLPPPMGGTPFIPPPPLDGMMPPPLGDIPPFMHGLPPAMFPGDHRPPPLGRMSSPPPVGGRYSPESTVYSEYDRYDRRSPSPPYDSEYGASPPPIRGYSPYSDRNRARDDRRDYKRPQPRSNGRNSKGLHSSGSENDSLGKGSKKPQRKV